MAKRKPKTKRKAAVRKGGKPRVRENEPVSLHPMKFTEALEALIGQKKS